ncbi:MAG TPA: MTAP family purine nucleoside phosphorylase [Armatimonadota bacterium]|nr:MTAP family purine nucleoside phosphorylase [Armatimonadota bacterium]
MLAIIAGSAGDQVMPEFDVDPASFASRDTPFGPTSPLAVGSVAGESTVIVARHGLDGYSVAAPFVNYRANVFALKERSVTEVIAWSGPGAIDAGVSIGQYVIPDDVLDETRRPRTFYEGTGLGVIRVTPVFCPRVSAALIAGCEAMQTPPRVGGTYVCTEGPRLETPAEICKYAMLGGHFVGMTLCPEVFLARELEICYSAILYVTNYAEGVKATPDQPGRLFGGLMSPDEENAQREAVRVLPRVIEQAVGQRHGVSEECSCQRSMERYRRSGRIGDDWRQWMRLA